MNWGKKFNSTNTSEIGKFKIISEGSVASGVRRIEAITADDGISANLAKENDWHAGNLIHEAAKHIQGGGGGQTFFATAGGKNPAGIDAAINEVLSKTIRNA